MEDLLPRDVWVLVCAHMPFDDATRLLTLFRDVDDSVYWCIAVGTRGIEFWTRALTRKTHHTFTSMRDELRVLFLFERHLRRACLPMWSMSDYYRWWDAEKRYIDSRLPHFGVDGGKGARHGDAVRV